MIIRIDDFPHGDYLLQSRHPKRHWPELFDTLVGAFERKGAPYVLAVSPGLCTEEDCARLRTLKLAAYAVHGWDHGFGRFGASWRTITQTWADGGEFAGMTAAEIRPKLAEARQVLASTLYICPFNAVNQATLDALADEGYTTVLAGQTMLDYHQEQLDYHGMHLDLCVPPYYGRACKVIRQLPTEKTIALHWIYEDVADVGAWEALAEACRGR